MSGEGSRFLRFSTVAGQIDQQQLAELNCPQPCAAGPSKHQKGQVQSIKSAHDYSLRYLALVLPGLDSRNSDCAGKGSRDNCAKVKDLLVQYPWEPKVNPWEYILGLYRDHREVTCSTTRNRCLALPSRPSAHQLTRGFCANKYRCWAGLKGKAATRSMAPFLLTRTKTATLFRGLKMARIGSPL